MGSASRLPARHSFDVVVRDGANGAVVEIRGALDIAHEPAFSQAVDHVRREGHARLRLDMTELDFIDSAGVSAVLRICREWAEEGRTVELVPSSSPAVARVFSLIGVDQALPFVCAGA
jgi:anti-sigma B factor antagonist